MNICLLSLFLLPYCIIAHEIINNFSTLNPITVEKIFRPTSEEEIQHIFQFTRSQAKKISMAGARHSKGGHSASNNAYVLDMRCFDKILSLDHDKKIIPKLPYMHLLSNLCKKEPL